MSHLVNTESFRKAIDPERGFLIITQETISDEYGKAKADATPAGQQAVEQVPVILAVKGPTSIRRNGVVDVPHVANGMTYWYTQSYRVIVGKTGVV